MRKLIRTVLRNKSYRVHKSNKGFKVLWKQYKENHSIKEIPKKQAKAIEKKHSLNGLLGSIKLGRKAGR
jgi:hypothetical protein